MELITLKAVKEKLSARAVGKYLAGTTTTIFNMDVFGLGEGGLVGCSKFAECFCPLLPNPCYMKCRLIYDEVELEY